MAEPETSAYDPFLIQKVSIILELVQDASKNLRGAVSVYFDWFIFIVERDMV